MRKRFKLCVSLVIAGLSVTLALMSITTTGFAQETSRNSVVKQAPRKQALWVANVATIPYFSIFQGPKLKKGGAVRPTFAFYDGGGFGNASGITFDAQHNFWVSFCTPGTKPGVIDELSAAHVRQLVKFGRTKHSVVLEFQNANDYYAHCPQSVQFDQSGNLWVSTLPGSTNGMAQGPNLFEYTPSQIAQSGAPIPNTFLTISEPSSLPTDFTFTNIRFDLAGNLWVSGGILRVSPEPDVVVGFTVDQLAAGGALAPNFYAAVSDPVPINYGYLTTGLAFDKGGNLWVAYRVCLGDECQAQLKMFAASDLSKGGTVPLTPVVTIDLGSLNCPDALAFDDLGDLWVANAPGLTNGRGGQDSIEEFTPDQLAASGSPTPKVLITANRHSTNISSPNAITFGPTIP